MDDEKDWEEYSKRYISPTRRTIGKIAKWALIGVVVLVNVLVFWRILFSDIVPKEAKTLTVNDAVYAAYEAADGALTLYTQTNDPVSWEGDTRGYFWVSQAVFVPDARQVQVLIRYNNSTLEHIKEDFALTDEPARTDDVADVTLVIKRTTLDEDGAPQVESLRVQATAQVLSTTSGLYNYRRFVFEDVNVDFSRDDVTVEIYYVGACDYDEPAYNAIPVLYHDRTVEPLELTARDRKALSQYR